MKMSLVNIVARGMRSHNLRVEYSPTKSARAPMGAKFGICGSKRSMTLAIAIITIKTKINLSLLLFIGKFPFNCITGFWYVRRRADLRIGSVYPELPVLTFGAVLLIAYPRHEFAQARKRFIGETYTSFFKLISHKNK